MKWVISLPFFLVLSGCAVVAVADLAVTTAATAAKAGVRTVGAAVDLVTPSQNDKSKDEVKKKN
ncbi:MAG: hypothetical protein EB072_00980 [Betaproteobacteria bacterium]|nr:hypothetical protein [Betaproteobacteria bacterium]